MNMIQIIPRNKQFWSMLICIFTIAASSVKSDSGGISNAGRHIAKLQRLQDVFLSDTNWITRWKQSHGALIEKMGGLPVLMIVVQKGKKWETIAVVQKSSAPPVDPFRASEQKTDFQVVSIDVNDNVTVGGSLTWNSELEAYFSEAWSLLSDASIKTQEARLALGDNEIWHLVAREALI